MSYSSELAFLSIIFLELFISILLLAITIDKREKNLLLNSNKTDQKESEPFKLNCQKHFLTAREIEILILIKTGRPYKIIADELNISEKTVKNHVLNMFQKTNASNKMELVARVNEY